MKDAPPEEATRCGPGFLARIGSYCLGLAWWVVMGGSQAWSAEALRVGLLLPPEEALRESLRQGAQQAVERFNATSAVPLRLHIRGRPGQWGDDGEESAQLVMEDRARVLIAPPGGVPSHLVLQVAGRTQIPVISLNGDDAVVGARIPWMVCLVPRVAEELGRLLGEGRWLLISDSSRAARELRRVVESEHVRIAWPQSEVTVIVEPAVPVDATAEVWRAEVEPWLRTPLRGVVLWLAPERAAVWVRTLRRAGFSGRLAGPGWLRGHLFLTGAGDAARGFRAVSYPDPRVPESSRSSLDAAGAMAYDAVTLAAALLLRAGDREMRAVFPLTDLGRGLTGPWRFDRQGRRQANWEVVSWNGQAWVRDDGH